jgi:hypothetical protein
VRWSVRRDGWVLKLYEHSLSLAFALLFLAAFLFHGIAASAQYKEEELLNGEPTVSALGYFATNHFRFESFQNWRSEFLAITAMVALTIFLRQKDCPIPNPSTLRKTGGT